MNIVRRDSPSKYTTFDFSVIFSVPYYTWISSLTCSLINAWCFKINALTKIIGFWYPQSFGVVVVLGLKFWLVISFRPERAKFSFMLISIIVSCFFDKFWQRYLCIYLAIKTETNFPDKIWRNIRNQHILFAKLANFQTFWTCLTRILGIISEL